MGFLHEISKNFSLVALQIMWFCLTERGGMVNQLSQLPNVIELEMNLGTWTQAGSQNNLIFWMSTNIKTVHESELLEWNQASLLHCVTKMVLQWCFLFHTIIQKWKNIAFIFSWCRNWKNWKDQLQNYCVHEQICFWWLDQLKVFTKRKNCNLFSSGNVCKEKEKNHSWWPIVVEHLSFGIIPEMRKTFNGESKSLKFCGHFAKHFLIETPFAGLHNVSWCND